jgi:hypothetical protein
MNKYVFLGVWMGCPDWPRKIRKGDLSLGGSTGQSPPVIKG